MLSLVHPRRFSRKRTAWVFLCLPRGARTLAATKRRGPLHKRVVLDEQVPAEYTGLQLWELHATDAMRPNRIHVETMVAERARREER